MQTIGLIGGMSWESTIPYYRVLNEVVRAQCGGLHSAKVALYSVDFAEYEPRLRSGAWEEIGDGLVEAARRVAAAGADFLVLCTNTMHKVAPRIEAQVGLPLLHIVDPTAQAIAQAGWRKVGLLGTRFTMEEEFYRERLRVSHGIEALVPDGADREVVNRVIFEELCRGRVLESSREEYRRIVRTLAARGAQAVILGCTEITLLIGAADSPIPLYDTTSLHATAAARRALAAL